MGNGPWGGKESDTTESLSMQATRILSFQHATNHHIHYIIDLLSISSLHLYIYQSTIIYVIYLGNYLCNDVQISV